MWFEKFGKAVEHVKISSFVNLDEDASEIL